MDNYSNHPLSGATDLDSSMNLLWEFLKKNFAVLYIISVVAALVSNVITSNIDISAIQSTTDQAEMLAVYKKMAPTYLLLVVISFLFSIIINAYILDKPVEGSYNFFNSLKKSIIAFFPYLAAMIVIGCAGVLAISLGIVMLILPGIFAIFYFITIYLFTMPVTLIESRNPGYIISRSLKLTHRNFWQNMGWATVAVLIVVIVSLVLSALSALPFTGTLIKSISDPTASAEIAKNPVYIIVASLTSALVTPVLPIMGFILYFKNAGDIKRDIVTEAPEENRVRVEDLYPQMPQEENRN